jgi:hypothetical protein
LPLEVIRANCRVQFTADDFGFVTSVLAKSPGQEIPLSRLLEDPAERDHILDSDAVYEAMIDDTACLKVSPAFFFYVMTRRALRQAGMQERALSDYVAAVLMAFSRVAQLNTPGTEAPERSRSFAYVSDVLSAIANAPPERCYALRAHLGNYTLFLTGIFAERVEAQAQRRGGPDIGFYESVGEDSFRTVSRHPQAQRQELVTVFEQLGGDFRHVRMALNDLAQTVLHMHPTPTILTSSA